MFCSKASSNLFFVFCFLFIYAGVSCKSKQRKMRGSSSHFFFTGSSVTSSIGFSVIKRSGGSKQRKMRGLSSHFLLYCFLSKLFFIGLSVIKQSGIKVNRVIVSSFSFPCGIHIVGGSYWASIEEFPVLLLL